MPAQGRQRRAWLAQAALLVAGGSLAPGVLHAGEDWALPGRHEGHLEGHGLTLQRDGEALLLSATMHWELPNLVQDALFNGIPVHFVAEVEMVQQRWYWSDKVLLQSQRFMRLSYQPLTRRWRLYTGSRPFEGQGLGIALSSAYDTLEEAIQSMQRIVRWRIGQPDALPDSGSALLQLRFRIDLSHFPRPLQIGALGRADWNLLVTRQQSINLEQLEQE